MKFGVTRVLSFLFSGIEQIAKLSAEGWWMTSGDRAVVAYRWWLSDGG
jgi:hypothetical protein